MVYFFAVASSVASVVAFIPYVWAILKGQTKPSGASWWTWSFITLITTVSAWFAGASWPVLLLPFWLCFSQLFVAILSLKFGDNNWDFLNTACVIGAGIGVLLWLVTGQPLLALAVSIIADLLASIPNIRHTFLRPEDESKLGWTLGWLSAVFEIFAIGQWTLAESGWALYFLLNMTITFVLVWRKSWDNVLPKLKNS